MKNMMTVCALFGAALAFPLAANAETLEEAFRNPPPATRPHVWWHWMGANVTEQGIRRDLQAMADAGIGGATVFNVRTHVNCGPTMENAANDKFAYRNDEYWRLLKVAAEEAHRLGLELLLHNCPGFSVSGGPWIMPDLSMKNLAWKTGDDPATLANPWTQSPSGVLGTWLVTNDEGRVTWYRGVWASTRSVPKPLPEDLDGRALEADKLSAKAMGVHADNVIAPLKERLGARFGGCRTSCSVRVSVRRPAAWASPCGTTSASTRRSCRPASSAP